MLGIFIFHGCSTLGKKPYKEVGDNTIFSPTSNKNSMDEFEVIKMDTPCWISTNPENCPDYQKDNNQFMYIRSKMITEKGSDKPTEQQYESMQKIISFQYFKLLNKEIAKDLFTEYSQCKDRKDLCNQIFNEYKSRQELIRSRFEIINHYWSQMNAQWELNALVAISYDDFSNDKKKIIEDEILSKIPKGINIYNDPPIIYID